MAKRRKETDETLIDIVEVKDSAVSFFEKNQNIILGAVTAVILLIGGWVAYNQFYLEPKNQEAAEVMFQAQFQFERDSFQAALNNPGGGYDGFLDIIDNYGGTDAGNLAHYYAAVCYLHLGQTDEALSYIKDFSADGEVMPIMKYGVTGDIYSEMQDFDEAKSAYEDAIDYDNSLLTPYYLNKLGLLLRSQGQNDEAKTYFERIKKEYPKSTIAAEVEQYL